MKNLLNLSLSAVIALSCFTSCDKKENEIKPRVEKEITLDQIKNPNNPYDIEGEMHNKFLDYFITHTDGKKEMTRAKLQPLYEGNFNENVSPLYKGMKFGEEQLRDFGRIMDAFSKLEIGGPYFNANLCKQFPALCDLTGTGPYNPIELLIPTNGTTSTERTLTYIKQITEEEAAILKNDRLEDIQKRALLNYYAVARYSSAYWHNVASIQKSKSGWYDTFAEGEIAALCHTCDVVGADAAGAAVGVLVGGVGAGPGAGIASGAAVLEKAWNWFWN